MDNRVITTILVAFLCLCTINCEDTVEKKVTINPKQVTSLPIEVSLFRRLNSNVTLEKLERIKFEENIISWKLDPLADDDIKIIYQPNNTQKPFNCTPNITSCYNLKIKNLTKELVGTYLRQSESTDLTVYPYVQYHLNAYETPIHVICKTTDNKDCKYNSTTNTLTVKENIKVFVTCFTNVYNVSGISNITMEHYFNGANDSCVYNNEFFDEIYDASNTDPLATRFDKTCSRTFTANDILYTCLLRNGTNQTDRKFRVEFDKIDIKLNVTYRLKFNETEYKAIKLNMSVAHGSSVVLNCPFQGNPIVYEWIITRNNSKILSNNKLFPIPKDLPRGVYTIECRVSIPGDMKSINSTKFTVNITKAEASFTSRNFIMGISIGAIVLSAIILVGIAVIIVYSIRKGKSTAADENKQTNDSKSINAPILASDATSTPVPTNASNQDSTPANS